MSILGGVYTFFGPIIGAFLLLFMDADITQNYPEIWQLFLGAVLVLILYGLPGGIMGFIQSRDIASADDFAARMHKSMAEFRRKFWYFFVAMLFFTGFFNVLKAPDTWATTLMLTLMQAAIGFAIFPWMLHQLSTFSQLWRVVFLALPLVPLALHIQWHTPLSGLMIIVLWTVFIYNYLWQAEVREAFHKQLELGIALASELEILLLDEPTAGMSPQETASAIALIEKIARERGLTLLFTEHDMDVVFSIAEKITVLHQGEVLAEGKPDDVRHNPEVQRVYLGEAV